MLVSLDNGASCIAFEPLAWEGSHEESSATEGVVLARFDGEYVTWRVSRRPSGAWDAYWGHYFGGDVVAASNDFGSRSGLAQAS